MPHHPDGADHILLVAGTADEPDGVQGAGDTEGLNPFTQLLRFNPFGTPSASPEKKPEITDLSAPSLETRSPLEA